MCQVSKNTAFFLVRILPHSAWIRRDTVSLRIQSECRKIRTRKNSVFGHFSRSDTVAELKNKLFIKKTCTYISVHSKEWLMSYNNKTTVCYKLEFDADQN